MPGFECLNAPLPTIVQQKFCLFFFEYYLKPERWKDRVIHPLIMIRVLLIKINKLKKGRMTTT